MKRKVAILLLPLLLLAAGCSKRTDLEGEKRILRTSINKILTTLDPARAADTVCQYMVASFYDTPLQYSYRKRPYELEPSMLCRMPEISENSTRFLCELRKDLYFQEAPCFPGRGREERKITSRDVVFSILRLADARVKSSGYWLIRDRIGKKPLYYWEDGQNLVFGSELKAIMACPGFPRTLRRDVLPRYLFQQYIPEPDTVFEQVFQLLPGEMLRFCRGRAKKERYWSIPGKYREGMADPVTDYGEGKARLKELLTAAVKRRMIADVELGTFLSGGYDSSLVTAIAAGLSEKPVKTFSIGFEEAAYDESGYAEKIASCLGTEHTKRIITEKEMFDLVESIPKYYDQPFADSSQIPTMLVSALAKEKVTVALSGDGGDEFFCGYGLYDKLYQAQRLDRLGGLVYGLCGLPGLKQAKTLEKLPFSVQVIAKNRDSRMKTQLCSPHYLDCVRKMAGEGEVRFLQEAGYGVKDWQVRRMLLDMETYLPGDILCKVDRASMKYSLEARCPILDRDVMEYSFRLPQSFKYKNGTKKKILKEIAWDYLPKELLERPKKGFSVPMDKWLAGPLKERLLDYADAGFLKRQGLFCPEYTQAFVGEWLGRGDAGAGSGANDSKILWAFFIFQQWYERWMQR